MRRSSLALTATALLAACTQPAPRPAPAPPVAVPRPAPPPAPSPYAGDWRDWPVTPGTWAYRQDARGSLALFGVSGGEAAVTLRCDRAARAVYLSVRGEAATTLTIRATTLTRMLPAQPTGGTPAYVAATLAPADGLLDAIGFSRGRFVIEAPGATPLVVPAWPEVLRLTEDCRG